MDPHDVLGVPVTATRDEIEAAYRAAIRRAHPDLHQAGGPDAVARAGEETRRLNEAIARMRASWLDEPPPTASPAAPKASGSEGASWGHDRFGYRAGGETDWFGNPADRRSRRARVECPFCTLPFDDPEVFRVHLAHAHGYAGAGETGRRDRTSDRPSMNDRLAWLGWIPAAWLWFAVVLVGYWSVVLGVLGDSPVASALVWLGVAGYAVALGLHYHVRRRSP
jgi:hypothetical protein